MATRTALHVLPVIAAAASAGAADLDVRSGYTSRPPGAREAVPLPMSEAVIMFRYPGFDSHLSHRHPVSRYKACRPRGIQRILRDEMSSVRWNLPPGIVVILYEDLGARGGQLVLWGGGEMPAVESVKFDDVMSGWAWYYVGGVRSPSQKLLEARASRPLGARPTRAALSDGSVVLYGFQEFKGERVQIDDVLERPAARAHRLPEQIGPDLDALQWSLPPGVLVLFSERPDGTGRQFAIWGRGEIRALHRWTAAEVVSSWSWYFVGDPAGGAGAADLAAEESTSAQ